MTGLAARIHLSRPWLDLDLSLDIPAGSTGVLLGPNGAGKTTAVMVVAGHLAVDDGFVRLGERTLDDPARGVFVAPDARGIGVLFQNRLLFPNMDVTENVAFGLRSRGVGRTRARAAAATWLDRFGLAPLAKRRPGELSGGEAQRVALARALITEPDLLLLDEPLAALDVSSRIEMRRLIAAYLAEFSGPRLLVTHDPTEAALLGDEVFVVEEGRLSQRGDAASLRLRPRTRYIADLVGTNLLRGEARGGRVSVDGHLLQVADSEVVGPVSLVIHPRAVGVHLDSPSGSARNSWETVVEVIEDLGDRVRLDLGEPLPVTAEITPAAIVDLRLAIGSKVWLSIKATEIGVIGG